MREKTDIRVPPSNEKVRRSAALLAHGLAVQHGVRPAGDARGTVEISRRTAILRFIVSRPTGWFLKTADREVPE